MSALPLVLAATPESALPFWIVIGVVVLIVALFIGLLVYVARRSRNFTPSNEDKN